MTTEEIHLQYIKNIAVSVVLNPGGRSAWDKMNRNKTAGPVVL